MYGHEPLIKMRLAGQKPSTVLVTLGHDHQAHVWHQWTDVIPHVCIEDGDSPSLLDLRCLASLNVHISDNEAKEARIREVYAACVNARADRVIAVILRGKDKGEFLDSAGVLQWVAE